MNFHYALSCSSIASLNSVISRLVNCPCAAAGRCGGHDDRIGRAHGCGQTGCRGSYMSDASSQPPPCSPRCSCECCVYSGFDFGFCFYFYCARVSSRLKPLAHDLRSLPLLPYDCGVESLSHDQDPELPLVPDVAAAGGWAGLRPGAVLFPGPPSLLPPLLDLSQRLPYQGVARVQLPLKMNGETFLGVGQGLHGATHFAHLGWRSKIKDCIHASASRFEAAGFRTWWRARPSAS